MECSSNLNRGKCFLYITGYGRHGKDTAAEILRLAYNLQYTGSSWHMASRVVYPAMSDRYNSIEECFADRHTCRGEWFRLICEYNSDDPARLSKEIFEFNDIYVGIRNREEIAEVRKQGYPVFVLWIDAGDRVPVESTESCNLTIDDADFVIPNTTTLDDFVRRVLVFGKMYRTVYGKSGPLGGAFEYDLITENVLPKIIGLLP